MRDQDTIESLAVNAVDTAITRCPRLSCEIKKKDKTPSWDGHIYIHKNGNKDKEGLRTIAVQVKGSECEVFSNGTTHFDADIEDLKNYLHNGGVLFFVVELNPEDKIKIFYETLLPIKLKSVLDEVKEEQQKKRIHLRPFPDDKDAIETIVWNFYQDAHKQTSFAESDLLSLSDLFNNSNVEKITVSTTKCGVAESQQNSFAPFFENELCAYVQMKGSRVEEPIKQTIKAVEFKQRVDGTISIAGKSYYDHYTQIVKKDSLIYRFGDVFEMSSNNGGNSGKLTYSFAAKTLEIKLASLYFIKAAIENKGFFVNNTGFNLGDDNPFDGIDYEAQIKLFIRISKLLSTLHVTQDLELQSLTDDDYKKLSLIAGSILENKPVRGIEFKNQLPSIVNLQIGNLRLKLVAQHGQTDKDIVFEDFFTSQRLFFRHTAEGTQQVSITTPAVILTEEELYSVSNLNSDFIISQLSVPAFNNDYSYAMINELLNRTLIVYDKHQKPNLLKFAEGLANWLSDKEVPFVSPLGRQLDVLQIAKRSRALTRNEIATLHGFLQETEFDQIDLIGIYLLLNKKREAKTVYKLMDDATKKTFNESPLHRFWK